MSSSWVYSSSSSIASVVVCSTLVILVVFAERFIVCNSRVPRLCPMQATTSSGPCLFFCAHFGIAHEDGGCQVISAVSPCKMHHHQTGWSLPDKPSHDRRHSPRHRDPSDTTYPSRPLNMPSSLYRVDIIYAEYRTRLLPKLASSPDVVAVRSTPLCRGTQSYQSVTSRRVASFPLFHSLTTYKVHVFSFFLCVGGGVSLRRGEAS